MLKDTWTAVLSQVAEPYLDDPGIATVGADHLERVFCSTWLPLGQIDGASEELREASWIAAGEIAKRWGEDGGQHVEETAIAGAWGLATPAATGALPAPRRHKQPGPRTGPHGQPRRSAERPAPGP
ncbi:MAG: hypothetical protein FWD04_08010 [Conexibacteraceae bacterium]|nr:hypothetical protein [Conexibacteraceae bacterium]